MSYLLRHLNYDPARFYVCFDSEKARAITGTRGRATVFNLDMAKKIKGQLDGMGITEFSVVPAMDYPRHSFRKGLQHEGEVRPRPRGGVSSRAGS